MRCACFLACSAKWVAQGPRGDLGGGGRIVPHIHEKGNARSCLCESYWRGKWREDRGEIYQLPFPMTQRLKAKKILGDTSGRVSAKTIVKLNYT